jgi:hypothetical protein
MKQRTDGNTEIAECRGEKGRHCSGENWFGMENALYTATNCLCAILKGNDVAISSGTRCMNKDEIEIAGDLVKKRRVAAFYPFDAPAMEFFEEVGI